MPVHLTWWLLRPVELMEHCRRRYGDRFTLKLPLQRHAVFFATPAAVRDLFTGSPDALHAGEANVVLEPIVGRTSILLLDGERHVRQRRLLMPPFHGERMLAYVASMCEATRRAMADVVPGRPTPVQPIAQRITLDVILETVLGVEDPSDRTSLGQLLTELLARSAHPLLLVPALRLERLPWTAAAQGVRLLQEVDRRLYAFIEAREVRGTREGSDVLAMLLEARDEHGMPMSRVELRDALMTLLLAGHETTATTLAWAFGHLVAHPDALARAHEEVDRVFDGDRLEPARVAQLTWIDAIVRETLRLRPVLPVVGRVTKTPVVVDGTELPAGVMAVPCIYLVHRHPDVWPRPERFDPERFLNHKPSPYEYLPFGGGARRCLGMAFALQEARVVLATMLRQWTVRPVPGHRTRVERRSITLAPAEGMPVLFERRDASRRAYA